MEETDFQAITRLKRSDLAGLDTLMIRYQLRAVRAAYLIVGDRPLAEDVVQDAFVRLHQTIHQFDEARPFGPWFLRSVVNDALKAAKRQQRQISLDEAERAQAASLIETLTDPHPDPETLAVSAETRREVWQALARLAPEQRVAIVQRYYLGYSEAEMSASLQRPTGTIKWLVHTARRRLRHWLVALAAPDSSVEPKRGAKRSSEP